MFNEGCKGYAKQDSFAQLKIIIHNLHGLWKLLKVVGVWYNSRRLNQWTKLFLSGLFDSSLTSSFGSKSLKHLKLAFNISKFKWEVKNVVDFPIRYARTPKMVAVQTHKHPRLHKPLMIWIFTHFYNTEITGYWKNNKIQMQAWTGYWCMDKLSEKKTIALKTNSKLADVWKPRALSTKLVCGLLLASINLF